jgi:polysaccharide biosynthesis protein PslH
MRAASPGRVKAKPHEPAENADISPRRQPSSCKRRCHRSGPRLDRNPTSAIAAIQANWSTDSRGPRLESGIGVRALYIAGKAPLPPDTGRRQRLWNILLALSSVADVDFFVIGGADPQVLRQLVEQRAVDRVSAARPSSKPVTPANILRCLRDRGLPSTIWFRDLQDVNAVFASWARPSYDVVWVAHPLGVVALRGRPMGPVVVDRDDLEEELLDGQLRHDPALRRLDRRLRATYDISMWKRFTREAAQSAARIVVCSPDDARRVNARNVVVIPNGTDRPTRSVTQPSRAQSPTLLFQGQMTYPPNADGAAYFVDRVLPHVLAVMPRVQFRIVGRCDDTVARLEAHPNVTVTDHVVDIEPELARADAVVVPLRFGSGTRLKIIEAFAHRIPVVSTTLGAEGLGATAGKDLLIADDDVGLAAACLRVLSDEPLRRVLADRAEALYNDRFQWSAIRERAAALACEVASEASKL